MEDGKKKVRIVAYTEGGAVEFPSARVDAGTKTEDAVGEIRVGTATAVDDDALFFAYLETCAAIGAETTDWKTERKTLVNPGFVSLTEGVGGTNFGDDEAVLLNASLKRLAVECVGADGTLEGYMFPPGSAAAVVGGRVAGAEPIAKTRRADGRVMVPVPFAHASTWRVAGADEEICAQEVDFATADVETADPGAFTKIAEALGIEYYRRDGKTYTPHGDLTSFVWSWRRMAQDADPNVEANFARFVDALADKRRAEKVDDRGDEMGERLFTERCVRAHGFVEAGGTVFTETELPRYMLEAGSETDPARLSLKWPSVDGADDPYEDTYEFEGEDMREPDDGYATEERPGRATFTLTERDDAIAKAEEHEKKRTTGGGNC